MSGKELAIFDSWVKKSDAIPPVRMAGAAKRVPDEDLAMFRESRLVSSLPSDIPVDGASQRQGDRAFLPQATGSAARRPRSWESDGSKRKAMRSVDRMIDDKLNSTTEMLLPPLSSKASKVEQVREALLNECKSPVCP
jgi:hypothetical protein